MSVDKRGASAPLSTFSGKTASQQPRELAAMIDLLRSHKITSYLEIGARHGDTWHEVALSMPVGSLVVAVDYPGGLWGMDSKQYLDRARDDLLGRGYNAHVIYGRSQDVANEVFALGPYDAVLIDADHTYEAVKRDFDIYGDCGIVAFHDIDGEGLKYREHEIGVPRLWRELKGKYKSHEFIDPSDNRPMGIGVIERD